MCGFSSRLPSERRCTEWAETRPAQWLEGLSQCDLAEEMPCKWIRLVNCARVCFKLGGNLGHAIHAFGAAAEGLDARLADSSSARQDGLECLQKALGSIAELRDNASAADPSDPGIYCDHLWDERVGFKRLLTGVTQQPALYSDAQLAEVATEANKLLLSLLVDGRPDLGLPPCPISGNHEHADCEWAKDTGP